MNQRPGICFVTPGSFKKLNSRAKIECFFNTNSKLNKWNEFQLKKSYNKYEHFESVELN